MSFISELELLSYPNLSVQEEKMIRDFLSKSNIIGMNEEIKEQAIELRKSFGIKLPDAIIGATAIHLNAQLITRDKTFLKVHKIKVSFQ